MAQSITVELGERSYEIHVGPGLLDTVGPTARDLGLGASCLIVTDSNVDTAHGDRCQASLEAAGFSVSRVVLPAGEATKDQGHLAEIYSAAVCQGLDRRSFIVALGGGVIGDLAGFAAASYLRGIGLVQVPTSVVAMVDSAVGGKTGINLPEGKNLVGAFYQPAAVVVDWEVLATLPEREYVSGLAEVVKYGVIRDRAFFEMLEQGVPDVLGRVPTMLEDMVLRSCRTKAEVVREDEREGGLRAILNFGHTLGHALEKVSGYGAFLHGEAISVGMVYAGRLSTRAKGFPAEDGRRLAALLSALGLPVAAPEYAWADLRKAMSVDKKNVGRSPRYVLARHIGEVEFGCEVPEDLLEQEWNVSSK